MTLGRHSIGGSMSDDLSIDLDIGIIDVIGAMFDHLRHRSIHRHIGTPRHLSMATSIRR
jgi:hypothetical protein